MNTPYQPDVGDMTKVYINEELSVQRTVVCAANKYGDLIICGARHHDQIMGNVLDALGRDEIKMANKEEQGFIDQYGHFLTREEGKIIALASGQKLRDPEIYDHLFSENLY